MDPFSVLLICNDLYQAIGSWSSAVEEDAYTWNSWFDGSVLPESTLDIPGQTLDWQRFNEPPESPARCSNAVVPLRTHCRSLRHFLKDLDRYEDSQRLLWIHYCTEHGVRPSRGTRIKGSRTRINLVVQPPLMSTLSWTWEELNISDALFTTLAINTKGRKLISTESAYGDTSRFVRITSQFSPYLEPSPRSRAPIAVSRALPSGSCLMPLKHVSNSDNNPAAYTTLSHTWAENRKLNLLSRLLRALYKTSSLYSGMLVASTFPRMATAAFASPVTLPTGLFDGIGELDPSILKDNDPATSLIFACLLTGIACESLAAYRLCPAHRLKSRAVAISLLGSLVFGLLFCSNIRQIVTVEWLGIHLSLTMVLLQGDSVNGGCFGSRRPEVMKHLDLLMC